MNYTICYFSKAKEAITQAEVEEIFKKTYANNTKNGIKGIVLFMMGDFFQVLEGKEKAVKKLYETIKADDRHHSLFEIINRPAKEIIFKDYISGFNILRTDKQIKEIKHYLRNAKHNETAEKIDRLLEPFFLLP